MTSPAIPLMLLLPLAITAGAVDGVTTVWSGIDAASVIVVGNGFLNYDSEMIRSRIEGELTRAGLTCVDIHQASAGVPRVTIVAHVDGMRLTSADGAPMGCVYHWSLSASCWADRVASGSGMVILEEHHDIGFGPTRALPDECVEHFTVLATHMAMTWLHDNPQ